MQSEVNFLLPGFAPHTRVLLDVSSCCLCSHWALALSGLLRPTGTPSVIKARVPSTGLKGALGQGAAAGWGGVETQEGESPALPTSLQLFKASGGRGKLLQMCGFVFFSTGTGRLLSRSGDSSRVRKAFLLFDAGGSVV